MRGASRDRGRRRRDGPFLRAENRALRRCAAVDRRTGTSSRPVREARQAFRFQAVLESSHKTRERRARSPWAQPIEYGRCVRSRFPRIKVPQDHESYSPRRLAVAGQGRRKRCAPRSRERATHEPFGRSASNSEISLTTSIAPALRRWDYIESKLRKLLSCEATQSFTSENIQGRRDPRFSSTPAFHLGKEHPLRKKLA
jgi:hypothetical protein